MKRETNDLPTHLFIRSCCKLSFTCKENYNIHARDINLHRIKKELDHTQPFAVGLALSETTRLYFYTQTSLRDSSLASRSQQRRPISSSGVRLPKSHVIGRAKSGKCQVIVRFLSYRTINLVYTNKKYLHANPDGIFITENLTPYRTTLTKRLAQLKFDKQIQAY